MPFQLAKDRTIDAIAGSQTSHDDEQGRDRDHQPMTSGRSRCAAPPLSALGVRAPLARRRWPRRGHAAVPRRAGRRQAQPKMDSFCSWMLAVTPSMSSGFFRNVLERRDHHRRREVGVVSRSRNCAMLAAAPTTSADFFCSSV